MWSDRCLFESLTTERPSALVTLTYNDDHLPKDKSVSRDDWTLFRMRLRKNLGRAYRFFISSEYGEDNYRPHYHVILFGFDVGDEHDMKALYNAWSPYQSEIGYFEADYLTAGRIRYALKYIVKEFGKDAELYESLGLKPLFHSVSKGVGKTWFLDHLESIRKLHGYYVDGKLRPLPRYYEDLLHTGDDEAVKFNRQQESMKRWYEKIFRQHDKFLDIHSSRSVAEIPYTAYWNEVAERSAAIREQNMADRPKY